MSSIIKDKNIAVTGASGFVGGAVAKRLNELGANVICIARQQSNIDIVNTNNLVKFIPDSESSFIDFFKRNNIDAVVHCATYFHAIHETTDIQPMVEACIELC
jgi:nucleoside-diphosphate-sugar epimerase